jgi:hypothetical protein
MGTPRYRIDEGIRKYGTEFQKQCIDAVNENRSMAGAARALGKGVTTVRDAIYAVEKKAVICGYAPDHDMTHPAPAPFVVKGVSTMYGADGKVAAQWVKTKLDESQAIEAVKQFIESMVEDARGLSPVVKSPKSGNADLLAVYPFGDPHFGMYAWAAEAGDDFDLETAERLTLGAVDSLVESAPPAGTAIILPLGDVFHANDQTNTTPGHKHQLDVDSRYPKVIKSGIKTFRHAILRALEKHPKVIVRIEPGNHDPQAKWALALALAAYFENDKRVEVDLSPSKFWFYRFGKVLIGTTHGDTVKHEGLPGVMAADRAEEWGQTKHRYWYTGHVHHTAVREFPGVVCESFRTLAAKDAFSAGHGYRAGRDMRCIVHHKDHGEVARYRCDISMLEAA